MGLVGRWHGNPEIYSGEGRYLGGGTDARHVQQVAPNRVRIDVSFNGVFSHTGHYFIEDCGDHRLYQGPCNVGFAETLGSGVIDANAYWEALGLNQRFFLMNLPDDRTQLSLALMSRGEQLVYAVVGQNDRVEDEHAPTPIPEADSNLLHRSGRWFGALTVLNESCKPTSTAYYSEKIDAAAGGLAISLSGSAFDPALREFNLITDGAQAWSPAGAVVGSHSLFGGRALSGTFHHVETSLRVWRREVAHSDGASKAVIHVWYRGGQRIGVEYGVLRFEAL